MIVIMLWWQASLVVLIDGLHIEVHESSICTQMLMLDWSLEQLHIHTTHNSEPYKTDLIRKFSEKEFTGQKLNTYDTVVVYAPKAVLQINSGMWIKLVEAYHLFGKSPSRVSTSTTGRSGGASTPFSTDSVGLLEVILKLDELDLKVDDLLNRRVQLSSKKIVLKTSQTKGNSYFMARLNPTVCFSTKDLLCQFIDSETAPIVAGTKRVLISVAVEKAVTEGQRRKLNMLLQVEAVHLTVLSAFKPVVMQQFADAFAVEVIEADRIEESKPHMLKMLMDTQVELMLRARPEQKRDTQDKSAKQDKMAAITVAVQIAKQTQVRPAWLALAKIELCLLCRC